jgi:hypothetical protein
MHDSIAEEVFNIVLRRNGQTATFTFGIRCPNKPGRFPVVIKNDRFVFDLNEIQDTTIRRIDRRSGCGDAEYNIVGEAYAREYVLCKFNRDEVAVDNGSFRTSGVFTLYPEYDWGAIAGFEFCDLYF